ncbi:hypothetical protein [Telluria aromaticivorans]|uniref:DUF4276 family protein n=1 Tax=Telluria aromaticivorans TaxID=2725995 RepID=A0A7Y2K1X8_9BURK|nr:hypothetical protein [Telluria aromaticivorans]NNG25115.1 hypothetical protein [Telluria aromaticivorans]
MSIFRYTLLADGTSDEVLMPILSWLIGQHFPAVRSVGAFAKNFGKVGNDLDSRIRAALQNFPCDLLIVHRDAETMSHEQRIAEVDVVMRGFSVKYAPLIPVRMTEAWLLADEQAIRFAAGNAGGNHRLDIPRRDKWESLPDPKLTLLTALKTASGKTGRALDKFNPQKARHLITPRSGSFESLRGLKAFDAFEANLVAQLNAIAYALD